jgi:hypothetical protein
MNEILEIFWMNPIWQTLGLLWMITIVCAYLQTDNKKIINILFISHIFWAAHFFYMEIYSWMTMTLVWLFRLGMTLKYKKNIKIFYGVLLITFIWWVYSYENLHSILPIAAALLWTYAFFYLERIKFRLALLICSSFWFNYHYINFSIWGIINESILQFIHVLMIYRLIVEQWGTRKYIFELKELFVKRTKIDYGRYIAITDLIRLKKKK